MHQLIYQSTPTVTFASNVFVNVPVILQFDDTPLISIVREQALGFTTEIPIYHSDGTYLAKVRGTRLFQTADGKKAGLEIAKPQGMTVCTLAGRTVFEIFHQAGDAFRTQAELHTPTGCFVKCSDSAASVMRSDGGLLIGGGMMMSNNMFSGCRIGIWIKSDGTCDVPPLSVADRIGVFRHCNRPFGKLHCVLGGR
jgi:hypothetical protein